MEKVPYNPIPFRKTAQGYQFFTRNERGQDVTLTFTPASKFIYRRPADGFACEAFISYDPRPRRGKTLIAFWARDLKTDQQLVVREVISQPEQAWISECILLFTRLAQIGTTWGENA